MMSLRVFCPTVLSESVQAALRDNPAVGSVAVMAGASTQPVGDLIIATVAREAANEIVDELIEIGLPLEGTIQLEPLNTWVSKRDFEAMETAPGDEADAVVWAEVTARAYDDTSFNWTFMSFLTLATTLATVAIVLDSPVLVIGAMVLGPDFGPVAAMGLAVVRRRFELLNRSLRLLAVGFATSIAIATLLVLASRALGWITEDSVTGSRAATGFIYHPDKWSVVVAILAGIAGVLALTSSSSNSMVGVFISVTTVPASGNIALGLAFSQWNQVWGSGLQLFINVTGMAIAGWLTLLIQQFVWRKVRTNPK